MEYRKVLDRWQVPDSCPMSVNQAFLLATRNGGLALKRPDLGVIAPGAKADIVVFKGDYPNMIAGLIQLQLSSYTRMLVMSSMFSSMASSKKEMVDSSVSTGKK
jgi:cytosine/adenosine deaminase-related metal-dependent hydrolase